MAQKAIFGPFFATMLLTLIVWAYKNVRRIHFITSNRISPDDLAVPARLRGWPHLDFPAPRASRLHQQLQIARRDRIRIERRIGAVRANSLAPTRSPVPSSIYITTCPQLAKAAMRAADEGAGFDQPSMV